MECPICFTDLAQTRKTIADNFPILSFSESLAFLDQ